MNILFFLTPKQDVDFIYDDFTLRQTLEKMQARHYSAVPIIRRTGEYVGTLTEGDILWGIKDMFSLDMHLAEQTPVMELVRRTENLPVCVETDIDDLISKSLNQNFVPVTDDRGVFIGIVTRKRVIQHLYERANGAK